MRGDNSHLAGSNKSPSKKPSNDDLSSRNKQKNYAPIWGFLGVVVGYPLARFLMDYFGLERPHSFFLLMACLMSVFFFVSLYKISSRSKHRFSITSLFYLTTIVSLYAGIYASMDGKGLVFSFELWIPMVMAQSAFLIVNRLVSNGIFFMESWGNQRENETIVVPNQWYWPAHMFIAFSILVLWTNRFWIDVFSLDQFYCFCMVFALWGHAKAVRRTSIRVYDEGVEIVDKFWRWEDGALKLFEHQGDFRLGPSRLIDKSKWRKYLWPVVPEENLEAVRESIILKQELAERREGYYAS